MRYFSVTDDDFPLVSLERGVATYRAPAGLHPRGCMMWACGKVGGAVGRVRVVDAAGALVAEALS